MIHVIRAAERRFTDFDWLKTYWLFSFSEYYDPANIQFGALRVFNDDVVAPHTGFAVAEHDYDHVATRPRAARNQAMSRGFGVTSFHAVAVGEPF